MKMEDFDVLIDEDFEDEGGSEENSEESDDGSSLYIYKTSNQISAEAKQKDNSKSLDKSKITMKSRRTIKSKMKKSRISNTSQNIK